uniref:DUF7378 domain-containing protein n=1 Tax=Leersia perrieri TaxID=77586 RepID=A0A0D9V539_9ORYZ
MFAGGFFALQPLLSRDPLFLARVPWRLPVRILMDTYLALIFVIRGYTHMYLPRAPVDVDENIVVYGICVVGGVALVTTTTILGGAVEDSRVVMACACFLAVLIAGLLAYWAWLVRKYGDN